MEKERLQQASGVKQKVNQESWHLSNQEERKRCLLDKTEQQLLVGDRKGKAERQNLDSAWQRTVNFKEFFFFLLTERTENISSKVGGKKRESTVPGIIFKWLACFVPTQWK